MAVSSKSLEEHCDINPEITKVAPTESEDVYMNYKVSIASSAHTGGLIITRLKIGLKVCGLDYPRLNVKTILN